MIVPMIPAVLALALVLAGCAAPAQPVPEVAQAEPAKSAESPPADHRIRETSAPVARPVWILDGDGETRAQLLDLRSIGGPRCLVVNGGASCDWRESR